MIKTPYLQKATSSALPPGGLHAEAKATACIHTLQRWGYEVMVGKTLGSGSRNYFSGTDEERRDEFQAMLDDPTIKAILRPGRLRREDHRPAGFHRFKKEPEVDHRFQRYHRFACAPDQPARHRLLHAPMASAFNHGNNKYIKAFKDAIAGAKADYSCKGIHSTDRYRHRHAGGR